MTIKIACAPNRTGYDLDAQNQLMQYCFERGINLAVIGSGHRQIIELSGPEDRLQAIYKHLVELVE